MPEPKPVLVKLFNDWTLGNYMDFLAARVSESFLVNSAAIFPGRTGLSAHAQAKLLGVDLDEVNKDLTVELAVTLPVPAEHIELAYIVGEGTK